MTRLSHLGVLFTPVSDFPAGHRDACTTLHELRLRRTDKCLVSQLRNWSDVLSVF